MTDFSGLALRRIASKNTARGAVRAGDLRALDRLSTGQLAAVELMVHHGLWAGQIAHRLLLEVETVRAWMREPMFVAAAIELQRAVAACQLVPYGLARIRQEMARPDAKLRDLVAASRFAAELAGFYLTGAPESGAFGPASQSPGKAIAEMSREELERAAALSQARLAAWDQANDQAIVQEGQQIRP